MKISVLRANNIAFKANEKEKDNKSSEVAIIAGGAGGTALTARVSNLNKTALNVSRGAMGFTNSFHGIKPNTKTFSDGILGCFKKFAASLGFNKLPLLKPIGKVLTSIPMRRASGFFGGVIAFATTIFGMVEAAGIFGELARK